MKPEYKQTPDKYYETWQKVFGVVTPGGDPCWRCPVCKQSEHVMGIETTYNYLRQCQNCGQKLKYPYETDE